MAASRPRPARVDDAGAGLGEILVRQRQLHRRALALALRHQQAEGTRLEDILVARGYASEEAVWGALGTMSGHPLVALSPESIDRELALTLMVDVAIKLRAVPVRRLRNRVVVAMADPADKEAVRQLEEALGGKVRPVRATPSAVRRAHEEVYRVHLVAESTTGLELRAPEATANRMISTGQRNFLLGAAVVSLLGIALMRGAFFILLSGIVIALYAAVVVFRIVVVTKGAKHQDFERVSESEIAALDDLPVYTVLCPLFREAGVLAQLMHAMAALDYPKTKLDVKLLLEEDDVETLNAVRAARLPSYFDIVVVPAQGQRTKPKACNYGLLLAVGEYVVIYDAEDVPDPDQLKKALAVFRRHGPELGCVQARLGYYNKHQNVLTGWFALEYAQWFQQFLPGLQRLGLPIPLGGSSNHLRTSVVREVGGWDPNNVTEDAELGMRLLRRGYRTAVVDSDTLEEANSDFVNWMRQRSRWGKGYAITWWVQMRHPVQLFREVGFWPWISIQLTLGGTFAIALLNLVMWALFALWVLAQFGFIAYLFPGWIYYAAMLELLLGNFYFFYLNLLTANRLDDYRLAHLALISPLYWVMISTAMVKAALQLFNKPAFWEKTIHGLYTTPTTSAHSGFKALVAAESAARAR